MRRRRSGPPPQLQWLLVVRELLCEATTAVSRASLPHSTSPAATTSNSDLWILLQIIPPPCARILRTNSEGTGNKMEALFRPGSVEVLSSADDFHDHNAKAIDIGLLRDL